MRVAIYSRVSTDAQERDGTSLDTQERSCHDFARASGWTVVACIRDAASGYSLERPGIEGLRRLLDRGAVDVILAYAVDRISRNQNHIGVLFDEVQRAGVRFDFATEKFEDTAVGRFILAARAFIAEVEREKIVERTTRGKLERARSGRIPQAMGKGTYGYTYDPRSGHRLIEPFQAEIVRRVFRRYAETRSFGAVSEELNRDEIPALMGGRWYPLTIRRILRNESYTGRLIFRRTQWVATRTKNGKTRRRPVDRPATDWIEIGGASPRIIDDALWSRVQEILADPERSAPRREVPRFYELRGRIKCGVCGSAMVGQTMISKGSEYKYYGCRHVYSKHTSHGCTSRYVRADALESGVWREVSRVLAEPVMVLQEWQKRDRTPIDQAEVERLERELGSLREREKRLVKLFSFGEIDETMIHDESAALRRQHTILDDQLHQLRPQGTSGLNGIDTNLLDQACAAVKRWLDEAGSEDRLLALEALQLSVVATREQATLSGILPLDAPKFFNEQHASA